MDEVTGRFAFDSLDRFNTDDLEELSATVPSRTELVVTEKSQPHGAMGGVEVISEVAQLGTDITAIVATILFFRDKLRRAQVVEKQGEEIQVRPDRNLGAGHIYIRTDDGLSLVTRLDDLSATIAALRSSGSE